MGIRENAVTMHGNPLTLTGNEPEIGKTAPDFTCLDNELAPKTLKDYQNKILVISSVPSLDTPVCDMQTRYFNSEADKLGEGVTILTISMDLPFAQARWCGAAGVDNVITLSDHKDASFGEAYGLIIQELRLLARAVLLIDKNGLLQYRQLVKEISQEPDYESVLKALKEMI